MHYCIDSGSQRFPQQHPSSSTLPPSRTSVDAIAVFHSSIATSPHFSSRDPSNLTRIITAAPSFSEHCMLCVFKRLKYPNAFVY